MLVDVEVVFLRAEEEEGAAIRLVPHLDVLVAQVLLLPMCRPVAVHFPPHVPVSRDVAVVAAIDDARAVTVRDDERLGVLLHLPVHVVVAGEAVVPAFLGAADGRFAKGIVVAPAHLVAHGPGLQLGEFGQVAVEFVASHPWRLVHAELLDQRELFPSGEVDGHAGHRIVQGLVALGAVETRVEVVAAGVVLGPNGHDMLALGEESLLRVGQFLEVCIVPLVAPTDNLHAVDVDGSLVIVPAGQPDLASADVLGKGETPAIPDVVLAAVGLAPQPYGSRSLRSADVAHGTFTRLPCGIVEGERCPGIAGRFGEGVLYVVLHAGTRAGQVGNVPVDRRLAVETAVEVEASGVVLRPDGEDMFAFRQVSRLVLVELDALRGVPDIAPADEEIAVDVDGSLVVVSAGQPDILVVERLVEGERASEPDVVRAVVHVVERGAEGQSAQTGTSYRAEAVGPGAVVEADTLPVRRGRGVGLRVLDRVDAARATCLYYRRTPVYDSIIADSQCRRDCRPQEKRHK